MNCFHREELLIAFQRIRNFVQHTPILTSHILNEMSENYLFLKAENLQRTGSFKIRGAYNMTKKNFDNERIKSVATHSSGNHAQALAFCAKELGLKSYIIMPKDAPTIKKTATESYGGLITECTPMLESREKMLNEILEEKKATFIPPYDHKHIITGQATVAMEMIDDVDSLDSIVVPIGGGGLISGSALATHYFCKKIKIIGAEPEKADDAYRSFASGSLQGLSKPAKTIADGLKAQLSPLTFSIIQKHVYDIIRVSEQDIINAMYTLWERCKLIVEPSGAVPIAAAFKMKNTKTKKRIGIVLSGGNVDIKYPWFDKLSLKSFFRV